MPAGVAVTQWWWGVPAMPRVAMPCGVENHWARWAEGELVLPAVDPEAERVLAALGGTGCRCGEIERTSAAHHDDLRVLTVAARTSEDPVMLDVAALRAVEQDRLPSFQRWEAHQRQRRGASAGDVAHADTPGERWRSTLSLLLILTLPNVLQRRLVATVAHGLEQRWTSLTGTERALAAAAVTGRAAPYVRASLVRSGVIDRNEAPIIDVRVGAPGSAASVVATPSTGGLRAEVVIGVDWLRSVWGREVALRADRFVTEVTEVTQEGALRGRAVAWQRSAGNTRVETVVEEWENDVSPRGESPS